MKRYSVFGFIAVSALLCCPQAAAWARTTFGSHRTPGPVSDTAETWLGETGTASYYGDRWNGRRSASGLRFDQRLMTAAHAWLPFGTRIRVTLGGGERSVIVTVTDRLGTPQRVIDLSTAAARELGMFQRGVARVSLAPP